MVQLNIRKVFLMFFTLSVVFYVNLSIQMLCRYILSCVLKALYQMTVLGVLKGIVHPNYKMTYWFLTLQTVYEQGKTAIHALI